MYVPDCQDVTHRNMFFSKNEETGMFDTRDAAQNILRAMLESHSDALKGLPQQLPGGSGSLYDLCNQPEAATDVRLCLLMRLCLLIWARSHAQLVAGIAVEAGVRRSV